MTHRANEKQDERACAECAPNDLKKLVDLSDQSEREERRAAGSPRSGPCSIKRLYFHHEKHVIPDELSQ